MPVFVTPRVGFAWDMAGTGRRRLEIRERRPADGQLLHPGDDRGRRADHQRGHHGLARRLCHAGAIHYPDVNRNLTLVFENGVQANAEFGKLPDDNKYGRRIVQLSARFEF